MCVFKMSFLHMYIAETTGEAVDAEENGI